MPLLCPAGVPAGAEKDLGNGCWGEEELLARLPTGRPLLNAEQGGELGGMVALVIVIPAKQAGWQLSGGQQKIKVRWGRGRHVVWIGIGIVQFQVPTASTWYVW